MTEKHQELMSFKEASVWASNHIGKNVTPSNISYLVQYGRIPKIGHNGRTQVNRLDLENYYGRNADTKEALWKKQLGSDLNWHLSFANCKEAETTKHVHRLHPYKGKFIPQLVEYFLDGHIDEFKRQVFFKAGDTVLDPFCGSGTTLVQSSELGLHAVGIDVSAFNAFVSNAKIGDYDSAGIASHAQAISTELANFCKRKNTARFERHLSAELKRFNERYFPSPEFKYKVRHGKINEKAYAHEKAQAFLTVYRRLVSEYDITLKQENDDTFLERWFLKPVREEIDFVFARIKKIPNHDTKKVLALILSRTIRSCRATTHADLGTLKTPTTETYYCRKHGKVCKPLFSIYAWWRRYAQDTVNRLTEFKQYKTPTGQYCLVGDSRTIDIAEALRSTHAQLAKQVGEQKIDGIFSSPPYVGLIDYHEQHAYAYDLLGFDRKDDLEIGPLYKGQGATARLSYVEGVSAVLNNCRRYMKPDYDVFLVANDKHNLYPTIAQKANMKIVQQYKRPVLNRVEKDRRSYAEMIFHLKEL